MSIIEKAVDKLRAIGDEPAREDSVIKLSPSGGQSGGKGSSAARQQIDFEALDRKGLLTPGSKRHQLVEEYRMLKRPLLARALGRGDDAIEHGNLVMVTSSLPGEGKTFTALNLAMSMISERDTTVLLIDGDVIQRSLSNLLGFKDYPGLIDILLDDGIDPDDVIVNTDVPTFRFLPAGRRHAHSTELLAGPAMRRIFAQLSQRFGDRLIVLDSPPLLATSEAVVLAGLAGQIVVVVEEGKTPQSVVKDALELLDRDKVTGLVLNKSHKRLGSSDYGYYYGYSK